MVVNNFTTTFTYYDDEFLMIRCSHVLLTFLDEKLPRFGFHLRIRILSARAAHMNSPSPITPRVKHVHAYACSKLRGLTDGLE